VSIPYFLFCFSLTRDFFKKNPLVGLAVANEVLIWGKKKNADELLACGFLKCVN
jgi:hypothetical protein